MKEYIKYIRSMVGHKEIMAVGVCVFLINEKEELLLETRSDNGFLSIPGGALDMGEKVKDGALRELKEETGIVLDDLKFVAVLSGEDSRMVYPNDDITYYTDVCFFARVNSDIEIKPLDNESKEIKFYKMDEIPFDKLLRLNQRLLTIYLKTKFQGEPYID